MEIDARVQNPLAEGVPEELVQYIRTGTQFIIAGHKEPDGDCVGSQLALRSALRRLGKIAFACSSGPYKRTEIRNFIDQYSDIPKLNPSEARVIIVDCSGKERTGDISKSIDMYPCAIIDHHSSVTFPPSTPEEPVYADSQMPSCTLLIFKLIYALGLRPTKKEAVLLFFGLCTDTGFFRFLNEKNWDVMEIASQLIRLGANPKNTYNTISGGKSLSSRILLGRILARTESHYDGKLLLSCETLEEYMTFGSENRDSDNLNQLLLSIEGVEAIIIIRQECVENCTVSLRSTDKINVSQIAAQFGGGGHKNAAGLTMNGSPSYVKQTMLESFHNFFVY
ncbi:MAG: bifunctional oligoribonuclease/PAP phosphatase NrnA [Treponema sp.]|nr:bifunctional oligoribonuclease/PAP phosphatase NrnA [Treponema sp.]